MQQKTIQMLSYSFSATTENSDGRLWLWELKLPSNYEVLLRKLFDDCTKALLSLSLCVCLFSVWVLRKCVKIISLEFLDMVFDWLWWGFLLLWNKNDPVMRFSFIRFWENKGKKINFNLEILDFILINLEGIKLFGFVVIKFWYLPDMVLYLVSCLDYSYFMIFLILICF